MHKHTGCICLTFLHCVFSNVSSNHLPELMHNHTGCICLTFPQCVFSNVSSIFLPRLVYSRIGSIYLKKASQITCLLQFLIDPSPCLLQEHLPDLSRRQVHPQVSLLMMSSVTRMCKCNQSNQLRNEIAALRRAPFFNFSSSLNVSRMEAIHHSFNHRRLKHCRTPSLKVMRQEGNPSRMEEIL